jgi:hypothetical protein
MSSRPAQVENPQKRTPDAHIAEGVGAAAASNPFPRSSAARTRSAELYLSIGGTMEG